MRLHNLHLLKKKVHVVLNKKETDRYWEGVPENTFYASGFVKNYIIIVPEKDLVVVLRWLEPSQVGIFMKKLISSLQF